MLYVASCSAVRWSGTLYLSGGGERRVGAMVSLLSLLNCRSVSRRLHQGVKKVELMAATVVSIARLLNPASLTPIHYD